METFGILNSIVLGIYLLAMLGIGVVFMRKQQTTEDYFLAGRRMPWLPVAMSMFASVTSATTFMGLPARAFAENLSLLIVCIISPLLVPILILVLYPAYRRAGVTTSYEFIGKRFGLGGRMAVSALFLMARIGWMGAVIYAPALALSIATGIPKAIAMLAMGVMATSYTVLGGLSAVLWTDVVQYMVLVAGAIWAAVSLVNGVPDGVRGILAAREISLASIVSWRVSLFELTALGVSVCFFLQLLQEYGTDQVTVQRMLAVRSRKGVIKATIFNACTDVVMISLLTFIGLALFAYYQHHPGLPTDMPNDGILPYYIMHSLPAGVSGLVISAIFAAAMSSMDSGINSLATVIQNDLIRPLRKREMSDRQSVMLARLLTVALGAISTGMAFYVAKLEHIVEAFSMFMGLFSAPVLALFMLGFVAKGTRFLWWVVSVPIAILSVLYIRDIAGVHWTYYFPCSFATSFTCTWVLSHLVPERLPTT